MRVMKRHVRAEEALRTILDVVKNTQDKMIHELMCDQTEEENFELCIAFHWLKINRKKLPTIPKDGFTKKEGQEIVDTMLARFEESKKRVNRLFQLSSFMSNILPQEEIDEDLRKECHPNLGIDKLCEIQSYLQMNVRDEEVFRN